MIKTLLVSVLGCVAFLQVQAAEVKWLEELPKALEKAKTEKKLVMINFTGSDWCPPCMRLDKQVLTSEKFATYASTNLVPVKVEFLRKTKQPGAVKERNQALAEKYKIEYFPTIVVLDSEGKEIGRAAYEETPEAFIAKLEKIRAKK